MGRSVTDDAGAILPGLLLAAVGCGGRYFAARFAPESTIERPLLLGAFTPEFDNPEGAQTFAVELAVEADRIAVDAQRAVVYRDIFSALYGDAWKSIYYLSSVRTTPSRNRRVDAQRAAKVLVFCVMRMRDLPIREAWRDKIVEAIQHGYRCLGMC